jgi:hypothetical protein
MIYKEEGQLNSHPSMLTPKHTIWDEIPNAFQTYKKYEILKYF